MKNVAATLRCRHNQATFSQHACRATCRRHSQLSIAKRHPQTAFAGLMMSLQHEWQYVTWTVNGIEALFAPVERAISGSFLPALLLLSMESIDADFCELHL